MPFPAYVLLILGVVVCSTAVCYALRDRPALMALTAGIGATLALVLHGPLYFDYYADDAYITLRYSRHLADGLGPNWNSTGRVEGYTTFLWMGTLAGFAKLGADLVVTSQLLGALSLVATLGAVYLIWRLWSADEPESGVSSPVVLISAFFALALTDGVAFWGFSGMETPLFGALLTLGAFLYMRERRGAGLPWSALAFVAAAMTRPEGVIAALVTGGFVVWTAVRSDEESRAATVRYAALWVAAFVVLYGVYFLWRYTYYDALLPNTFYAKVGPTEASLDRGLDYVWTYGLRYQLVALFAGAGFLFLRPRLRLDAAYAIALTGALLLAVVIEGGDVFPHGRFIAPILPLLYLTGLTGLATLMRRLALPPVPTAALASALLSIALLALIRGSDEYRSPAPAERTALEEREVLGKWLTRHTPPDYTIAAFAVGALGYYTDRGMLDLLGINDPIIARADVDVGTGLAGHEKHDADYVYDRIQPEIIIISDANDEPMDEEQLRREAFRIPSPVAARNALLQDSRLWERYDVRSLRIGDRWFNFLQRADTADELKAPGLE